MVGGVAQQREVDRAPHRLMSSSQVVVQRRPLVEASITAAGGGEASEAAAQVLEAHVARPALGAA